MKKILAKNYQENRSGLLSYIRSKIDQIEEAEDILQEVYIQAIKSLSVTEPIDNLLGWLFTVANNKIIDWYRKKSRRNLPIDETLNIENIFGSDENLQFDPYSKKIIIDKIMAAIEELPMEQKNVFIMNKIEEKSFREIAAIENISINTALARSRYAVKTLRKKLQNLQTYLKST